MNTIEQFRRYDNIPQGVNPTQVQILINQLIHEHRNEVYAINDYFYTLARLQFIYEIVQYLVNNQHHKINDIYNVIKPKQFKNRRLIMKRSEIYIWLKKIGIYANVGSCIPELFKKSTHPKIIHTKYTQQTIDSVLSWCKYIYVAHKDTTTSMWQNIRHEQADLNNVALTKNIYWNDLVMQHYLND